MESWILDGGTLAQDFQLTRNCWSIQNSSSRGECQKAFPFEAEALPLQKAQASLWRPRNVMLASRKSPTWVIKWAKARFISYRPNRNGLFPRINATGVLLEGRGLVGYYCKFAPQYGNTDLTKEHRPNQVVWMENCQSAFDKLKSTRPISQAPDFDKSFVLNTDASDRGTADVLLQKSPVKELHAIFRCQQKAFQEGKTWGGCWKRVLFIICSINKLKHYLWGRRFLLRMDHSPLLWLDKIKYSNCKLLRWRLAWQGFDFETRHKPGKDNVVGYCCLLPRVSFEVPAEPCFPALQSVNNLHYVQAQSLACLGLL